MSSDYGSDIPSDDLVAIDANQSGPVANAAPLATPRQPLRTRNPNALATPPSSHSRKWNLTVPHSLGLPVTGSHIQHQTNCTQHATVPVSTTPVSRARQHGARHDAPASSQPLPTPSSATMISSSSHPPPSSQPTPSKCPTEVRRRQSSDPEHGSTQSIPRPHDNGAPLYRFPFGLHRGKTLLEVPENYIAYLRINQDMADSMPGLAAALSLYDAGQPPVGLPPASKPPSSSQPAIRREPSPPPFATPPASQPARMPSSKPSESSDGSYRFDFGKHAGKTLDEVPEDYINFLKQKGIVESRPGLAVAVIKHEREHHKATQSSSQQSASEKYTFKFGKYVGRTLEDVPTTYIAWLKTSNIYLEDAVLRRAIYGYEQSNVATPKTSSKRKRSSKPPPTWSGLSSGRSYAPRRRLYY